MASFHHHYQEIIEGMGEYLIKLNGLIKTTYRLKLISDMEAGEKEEEENE